MRGIIPIALAITVIGFSGAEAQVVDTSKHEKVPVVQLVDTTKHQKALVLQSVGTYPAFTNYSVQANPAFVSSSQIGKFWTVETGRVADGTRNAGASLGTDIGGATVALSVGAGSNGKETSRSEGANVSVPLAKGILVGGNVTTVTNAEGKTKTSSSVGAVGVYSGNRYLVRAGVSEDVANNTMNYAGEFRRALWGTEATVSGRITMKDGKVADKGIGAQVKRGPFLLSAGKGGQDWRDTKLHMRIFLEKTKIDLHVIGTGSKVLTNPTVKLAVIRNFR